jgi:predicted nucleic acid-binding protein
MARFVLLDAGVVGLLCCSPSLLDVRAARAWLDFLMASRAVVVIPELTDYEVRRGLLHPDSPAKRDRLEALRDDLVVVDVSAAAWKKASECWAFVRKAGKPTADPLSLDADAVLAGIAATIGSDTDTVIIATTNVGHLQRFPGIDARWWAQIT